MIAFLFFLFKILAAFVPFALPGVLGLLVAVDPASRRPGVGIKINLRSGPSSAAGGDFRILLLSTKNAANGTATAETLYSDVIDADAVGTLAGVGGMAHLCAQRLFEEYPQAKVDAIFMAAASGNTATGTITFDDASGSSTDVTVAQTVVVNICGRIFEVVWNPGEDKVAIATKLVTKIGQLTKSLPVLASNSGGTAAAVTITFKQKGKAGLDVRYSAKLQDGVGGAVTPGSLTAMTGGTTEPSAANCLAALAKEYRIICPCLSNADVATASTTCNMGLLKAYIAANDSGIGALLQTAHSACTDTTAHAKAMSGQHDFEYFSHHLARGALSLPCEWTGAICGAYAREFFKDPNHPMIEIEFISTLYGSSALSTDALSDVEEEDLLNNGVSYVGYTAQGAVRFERPISTYFADSDGNPDDRVLDISKTFGMIAVGADLRALAQRSFRGKKLMKTLPSGHTPVPPGIVGEDDARGILIGRLRSKWVVDGVILGSRLDEVIADGSLVIQVDPIDETQLDAFLPLRIVPPLVKTSLYLAQA